MTPNKNKVVLLSDFSEVLFHGINGMDTLITIYYGKEVAEAFRRRHQEKNHKLIELFRRKNGETEDAFWLDFLSNGEFPMNLDDIKSIFTENMHRKIHHTFEVYTSIIAYPEKLGGEPIQGYPDIYIASDHIAERVEMFKTDSTYANTFAITKGCFWSCELGCIKQDPEFFPQVLEKIGITPAQAVFIDDIEANVESAERSGIYSILFDNSQQLQQQLEEIGFRFV